MFRPKRTNIRYESICLGWYSPGVGVGLGSSPGVGVGVDAPCVVAPGVGVGAGVSPSPLAQSAGMLFPINGIGGLVQIMVTVLLYTNVILTSYCDTISVMMMIMIFTVV